MGKITKYYKTRQEWLADRGLGIGASEAGTVLGVNPWETPYQLWRRKRGLDGPKEESAAMRAGHYLEDAVARFYAGETGAEIIKRTAADFSIVCAERPHLRVSPDRLFWPPGARHGERQKAVLECKTTRMSVDAESVPMHWYCQLQMNMGVGEYDSGALAWLTRGSDFGYRNYDLDPDFFGWMTGELDRFWTDCVVGGREPESVTAADVELKGRVSPGVSVEATDEVFEAAERLAEAKRKAEEAAKEADALADTLKVYMGDADTLAYRGRTLCTWKAGKESRRFDAKRFEAENPETAARYMKTAPGARRFLLKV